MRSGANRRAARKAGGTARTVAALAVVVLVLGAVGAFLYLRFGRPRPAPLSTTPGCLQGDGRFCTGVALKEISRADIAAFTSSTGVFPSIVEYYQAFGKSFSVASARQVAVVGARPFIQLNPHKISMTAIARGQWDPYLLAYAKAVRGFGHQVMLSFGHEMNGDWSSWSEPFTKPADFIAAWRHIHTVFAAAGVTNVTWAWDVSHAGVRGPKNWWPGGKYVDWIGIDGYLRPGQSFAGQFWRPINVLRKLGPGKPVFIAETAVAPSAEQTAQIRQLFGGAVDRHVRALIWFNVNKQRDWQLQANTAAAAAFRVNADAAAQATSPG